MKRFFVLFLAMLAIMSASFAESANTETVAQMTCIIKLPDVIREGKYTGEVQNGVPHGYGVFVTVNSEGIEWHYLGQWDNGAMSGQGGQYWNSGTCNVGTFMNGDMVFGEIHQTPSQSAWIDYRPDEDGNCRIIEYRSDGSVLFDGYADAVTGNYKKGTVYTKDGKVFFSGEIGEGFNWNLVYID